MQKKVFFYLFFCCVLISNNPANAQQQQNFHEIKLEKGIVRQTKNTEIPEVKQEETIAPVFFGKCEDGEVFSPGNIPETIRSTSTAVDIINYEDIRKQQNPAFRDLLNEIMGITVQDQGSIGDTSTFRIRGNDRVRVTIDGMRIDDPFDNKFYLNHFLTDDIERVEILRGPQGTVNGVQSTGGLVSIQTRRGKGSPSIELESNMGSFKTFKERSSIQGGNNSYDYFIGLTRLDTAGGMTTFKSEGLSKNDDYHNLTFSSNIGKRLLKEKAEIRNNFQYIQGTKGVGIDFGSFDPNRESINKTFIETSTFSHSPTNFYNYFVRFGVSEGKQKIHDYPDNYGDTTYFNNYYKNRRLMLTTQHNLQYKKLNTFSIGYNLENNDYDNITGGFKGDEAINDIYFNDSINIKDIFFIRGGSRISNSSTWGTYATPNVSAAVVLPTLKLKDSYTKIRSSYGRAINNPTPYQLFVNDSWTKSNPNLKPENLEGWDVGFTQSFLNEKILIDGSYFRNDYKNYVGYVSDPLTWVGQYQNINSAHTCGWESSLKVNPSRNLKTSINYTYTESQDNSTNRELPASPQNRFNYVINYSPLERVSFFAVGTKSSNRIYSENNRVAGFFNANIGTNIRLFSYKLANLYFTAQVKNITNDKYEVYRGYRNPGTSFLGGLFINIGELVNAI